MKFFVVVKPLDGEFSLQQKIARFDTISLGINAFEKDRILILSSGRNMARGDVSLLSKALSDNLNSAGPVEVHQMLGSDINPQSKTADILRLIELRRNKAEVLILIPDPEIADVLPDAFTDSEGYARIFKTEMKPGEAAIVDCELRHLHLVH